MRYLAIAIVLLLTGCSGGTGIRAIDNTMCGKHTDEATCIADTGNSCHWNAQEKACKN